MTLTELSYQVRKAMPFLILFGLVFLILFYSVKLYFVYLEANRPDVTFTNIAFGRISHPQLTDSTNSSGFEFTLDTIEGVPVTATGSATVYFLPDTPTRFGYREKIYLMAKAFGFDTESVKHELNGKEATFDDGGRSLSIDIGNFNFKFNNVIRPELLVTGSINLSQTEIVNKAVDFLKRAGRYPDELSRGTTNVIYLKYDPVNGDFVNVQRPSEASAVEVDFYRPTINGLNIVTPKFFNSQNYVIMTLEGREPNIIRSQIGFFEKSEEQTGVYPLITGEQAWMKLKAGEGKIVAGRAGTSSTTIKKMFTAYFDPGIYQPYLQPVYVFLGDNDFVAYVTAVKDEFLAE